MVLTRSACLAASAADPARSAPARTACSSAAGATSKATTANPLRIRLAAIGRPIAPVPMNAIFMPVLPPDSRSA